MRAWPLAALALVALAHAQPELATRLGERELLALEELVALALANDPEVLAAGVALPLPLGEVLSIDLGTSLYTDPYGQVEPSFSLSVRLDALALLDSERGVREARLRAAEASARLRVVGAFVAWRVARERAEVAALALETAREQLRVAEVRLGAGAAIPAELLAARDRAAGAALALLEANGTLVLTLEGLAAAVGVPAGAVLAVLP